MLSIQVHGRDISHNFKLCLEYNVNPWLDAN